MGQVVPDAVERYLSTLNRLSDPWLERVAKTGASEHLPLVDAEVGALLRLLVSATGARRILEIGTAIGYSGLWLAGALPPDGLLVTIERDSGRAKRAREHFEGAGLSSRASVMIGDAERLLAKLAGPFDVIFQDGDKRQYPTMLDRLVTLLRPGGLLITDNVLWDGEVVPGFVERPTRDPDDTRAIAQYNEQINTHPLLMTVTLPLRDGVAVSLKRPQAVDTEEAHA